MKNLGWITTTFTVCLMAGGALLIWPRGSTSVNADRCQETLERVTTQEAFPRLPEKATQEQIAERIHSLGQGLAAAEQRKLWDWMCGTNQFSMPRTEKLYLVNEVMDSLCQQRNPMESLTDDLVKVINDQSGDPGIREYAIQHLLFSGVHDRKSGAAPKQRNPNAISSILMIAQDPKDEAAGTALLILDLMIRGVEQSPESNNEAAALLFKIRDTQLRPTTVALATDPQSFVSNRVTALQVCAERQYTEILPIARNIAAGRDKELMLRLSAIAALGKLGGGDDVTLLNDVATENNLRLQIALQTALRKLRTRLNGSQATKATGINRIGTRSA